MIKKFGLNTVGRDFVVGDIHGNFDELEKQLKYYKFFNEDTDRLFSVGDLVDRGPKSDECIKWLNKPWFHAVAGNHEIMAIDTFNGEWDKGNYFQNGGAWFLGLTEDEQFGYIQMFNDLPIIIEVETKNGLIGIVHAEYPFNTWDEKDKIIGYDAALQTCIWSRSRNTFLDETIVEGVHKIYCGHTPVGEVTTIGNHVYIDTGCFYTGELTIMEI